MTEATVSSNRPPSNAMTDKIHVNASQSTEIKEAEPSMLSKILCSPGSLERIVGRTAAGVDLTMKDFLLETARWRAAFEAYKAQVAAGLERTPRVVLFTDDTVRFLSCAFGAWAAGVETVLTGDALEGTLERLVNAGIVDPALDALTLEASSSKTSPVGKDFRVVCVDAFLDADEDGWRELPVLPDDAVLCSLFTSGSTGEAKRVPKRLGQLFFETEGIARAFGDAGVDFSGDASLTEVLATVTHQHIYGILFRAFLPLLVENCIVTSERAHYPESLARAMKDAQARGRRILIVTSPAHLSRFDEYGLFADVRDCVVGVSSSAGPLDAEGARHARLAFRHWPLEVLGSTETGGIARRIRYFEDAALERLAVDDPALLRASIATPSWYGMPGTDVALLDASLKDASKLSSEEIEASLRREGTGLLLLKAKHLWSSGWEAGADQIELHSGGFTLLGRADRVVKIEGKRVALPEIEAALGTVPFVAEAKVLMLPVAGGDSGVSSGAKINVLGAVIVLTDAGRALFFREGKRAVLKAIRTGLQSKLSLLVLPKRWRFVDYFPANAQGKASHRALLALFDERRPEWLLYSDDCERDADGRLVRRRFDVRLDLPSYLAWFEGHFPGLLLLPGVAQLLLVQRALEAFASENPVEAEAFGIVRAVKNLKFKAMTHPGMRMALEIDLTTAGDKLNAKFSWQRLEICQNDGCGSPEREFLKHLHSCGTIEFQI